jgi:hypothetical protein
MFNKNLRTKEREKELNLFSDVRDVGGDVVSEVGIGDGLLGGLNHGLIDLLGDVHGSSGQVGEALRRNRGRIGELRFAGEEDKRGSKSTFPRTSRVPSRRSSLPAFFCCWTNSQRAKKGSRWRKDQNKKKKEERRKKKEERRKKKEERRKKKEVRSKK